MMKVSRDNLSSVIHCLSMIYSRSERLIDKLQTKIEKRNG